MIQPIAIKLEFTELVCLVNYAKAQAKEWNMNPAVADHQDKKVIETCEKIRKLILANSSTEFILMDKPF